MATGENRVQRALHGYVKVTGVIAIGFFLAIAVTGPFRGAPALIVMLSAAGAVLMALLMWFRYFRQTRR